MPVQDIHLIHLKRFRKFRDNELSAEKRNVLVGANNSGKTSVLHALRLFFYAVSGEFSGPANNLKFHKRYISVDEILPVAEADELWTDRIKGSSKASGIVVAITFSEGLVIEAVFTFRFGQVHCDASVQANPQTLTGDQVNQAINHKLAFIPGLVGILPQEPYVTPARRSAMSIEARYSEMYRSSLLHLNSTKKAALKTINKVLKQHLDVEITLIRFDPEKDVYVDIEYSQNGVSLDLGNSGSGMLQLIQLLVYIYLHAPSLLLIDEPDSHLHPELQEKIGPILKQVASDLPAQLFMATHSPEVIDSFDPKEVFFIDSTKKKLRPFRKDNAFVEGLLKAGIVTNSSLSRIAVRPRCLVVEDTNIATFRAIDQVLGTKLFADAGGFKRARGVGKFPTIHEVYLTVQDVVGKKISLYFVQDSDGHPERYLAYMKNKYQQQQLDVSLLKRHEIESYLLDAKIIRAALADINCNLSLKQCREFLIKAAEGMKGAARGEIRRRCVQTNKFCDKPEGFQDADVERDVDQWFDALRLTETVILEVFPAKELLKAVRLLILERHRIDLRDEHLRKALTRDRLADDVKAVFEGIAQTKNA